MISAIFFLISHYVFLIFLEGSVLIQGFIVVISFTLFLFLYAIYERLSHTVKQEHYALENIIGYVNLLAFFFLSIDIFYLDLQIQNIRFPFNLFGTIFDVNLSSNQKFILFLFFFIASVFLLSYSSLKVFAIVFSYKTALYTAVLLLVSLEFFWAANFLPVSVYSKGALVTLLYYAVLGFSRHYLIFGKKGLSRKIVERYVYISMIGFFLVFLTSRW
jgi:hypothetical protein